MGNKTENIVIDLKSLEDIFELSNSDENLELFSNKTRKVIGKFKIGTLKIIWIDEFIAFRSKMFTFRCGDDSKIKLKGISHLN